MKTDRAMGGSAALRRGTTCLLVRNLRSLIGTGCFRALYNQGRTFSYLLVFTGLRTIPASSLIFIINNLPGFFGSREICITEIDQECLFVLSIMPTDGLRR